MRKWTLIAAVCVTGCTFSVDPIDAEVDASVDISVRPTDDLTQPPDLTRVNQSDLTCSSSCANVACGQLNACGAMCCAATGCTAVTCDPQCQTLDACGGSCVQVGDGTPCTRSGGSGMCRMGSCAPAEHTIFKSQAVADPPVLTSNSEELGVQFTSDRAGSVVKLRFYKPSGAVPPHTGHLWDGAGNLLATAPYTSESASGWQETTLPSPIPIAANTTYVASFSTHTGFDYTNYQFNTPKDSPPLHVPAGGGIYSTAENTFPTQNWVNSNFWVDVVTQDP